MQLLKNIHHRHSLKQCFQQCVQAVARGCKARKQVHEMRVLAPLLHLCLHKKAALVRTRYRPVSLAITTLNSAVCRHVGLGQSKVTEGRGSKLPAGTVWWCLACLHLP